MDPQQRLLLETSWEALERAGIDPHRAARQPHRRVHRRRACRTTARACTRRPTARRLPADRQRRQRRLRPRRLHAGPGGPGRDGGHRVLRPRWSALHLACQALRSGECTLALAGGVAVMAHAGHVHRVQPAARAGRRRPLQGVRRRRGRHRLRRGRRRLVLERLSDARRNGHHVLAVVRGSAVNQDGASNGLTAPNGPAQQRVIRQALANAGLDPPTSTSSRHTARAPASATPSRPRRCWPPTGRAARPERRCCSARSSPTSATPRPPPASPASSRWSWPCATVSSRRPCTSTRPTPHVDWASGSVELLTEPRPWPRTGRPRRAGVSSFGISGTNAHVILEQPPPATPRTRPVPGPPRRRTSPRERCRDAPGCQAARSLSARGGAALRARAADLLPLRTTDPADLAPRPGHHPRRACPTAPSSSRPTAPDCAAALDAARRRRAPRHQARPGRQARPSCSPGRAASAPAWAANSTRRPRSFAEALDDVCAHLDLQLARPLRDVLFAEPAPRRGSCCDRTEYAQPALFALEVALYRLLEILRDHAPTTWPATPSASSPPPTSPGSSPWRTPPAWSPRAAGSCRRCPGGAMVAVRATEDEVAPLLTERAGRPRRRQRPRLRRRLRRRWTPSSASPTHSPPAGTTTKRLRVSHAFHSPLMEPMLDEFRRVAQVLDYAEPAVPVVSTVTGARRRPRTVRSRVLGAARARRRPLPRRRPWLSDAGVRHLPGDRPGRGADRHGRTARPTPARPPAGAPARPARGPRAPSPRSPRPTPAACRVDWARHLAGRGRPPRRAARPTPSSAALLAEPGTAPPTRPRLGQIAAGHPLLAAVVAVRRGGRRPDRTALDPHPPVARRPRGLRHASCSPAPPSSNSPCRRATRSAPTELEELTLGPRWCSPTDERVAVQVAGRRARRLRPPRRHRPLARRTTATRPGPGTRPACSPAPAPPRRPPRDRAGCLAARRTPTARRRRTCTSALADAATPTAPPSTACAPPGGAARSVFAEVALPASRRPTPRRFGLHPALLDAALHAAGLVARAGAGEVAAAVRLAGVRLHATGASALRVRLTRGRRRHRRRATCRRRGRCRRGRRRGHDRRCPCPGRRRPVRRAVVAATARPTATAPACAPAVLDGADAAGAVADDGPTADAPRPSPWTRCSTPPAADVRGRTARPAPREPTARGPARQVLRTPATGCRALASADRAGRHPRWSLVTAAPRHDPAARRRCAGLVRSAQSEHPGRFVLVDADGPAPPRRRCAARSPTGEPSSRSARAGPGAAASPAAGRRAGRRTPAGGPDGTVLVTGGTGGLGAPRRPAPGRRATASRHLLLASRRGPTRRAPPSCAPN